MATEKEKWLVEYFLEELKNPRGRPPSPVGTIYQNSTSIDFSVKFLNRKQEEITPEQAQWAAEEKQKLKAAGCTSSWFCENCGTYFRRKTKRKIFCKKACRIAYHNRINIESGKAAEYKRKRRAEGKDQ